LSLPQLFVGELMSYLYYMSLFDLPLPQLFVGELMSYLYYMCLFADSGVLYDLTI
jgi:hypothetical protein